MVCGGICWHTIIFLFAKLVLTIFYINCNMYIKSINVIICNYCNGNCFRRVDVLMSMENKNEEVTFEIVEHIGVIAEYKNKWSKELNRISWNGGNPKFDIRDWDEKHEHMSRGITIHGEEMVILFDLLKSVFNEVEVESCGA